MVRELRPGDRGPDVIDLRHRLRSLGFEAGQPGDQFDLTMGDAVKAFQQSRGLQPDGQCGTQTWKALVEASFQLGDRLICLTAPMMRGDDVAELQLRLGSLGFDAGRVDGIFGAATQRALGDFQQNVGIVCDFVCGPVTTEHLVRLATRGGSVSVAGLREREQLNTSSLELIGMRIAICHKDDDGLLAGAVGASLHHAGATVAVFSAGDWSQLAVLSNSFDATMCLGLATRSDETCQCSYFATDGFVSFGGQRLAEMVIRQLPKVGELAHPSMVPMRVPLLRETRASAMLLEIGPEDQVLEHLSLLAASIQRAIVAWIARPV